MKKQSHLLIIFFLWTKLCLATPTQSYCEFLTNFPTSDVTQRSQKMFDAKGTAQQQPLRISVADPPIFMNGIPDFIELYKIPKDKQVFRRYFDSKYLQKTLQESTIASEGSNPYRIISSPIFPKRTGAGTGSIQYDDLNGLFITRPYVSQRGLGWVETNQMAYVDFVLPRDLPIIRIYGDFLEYLVPINRLPIHIVAYQKDGKHTVVDPTLHKDQSELGQEYEEYIDDLIDSPEKTRKSNTIELFE